jgi:hypothetical protein
MYKDLRSYGEDGTINSEVWTIYSYKYVFMLLKIKWGLELIGMHVLCHAKPFLMIYML